MNPAAILALISDLYSQALSANQALEEANARIAELEAEIQSKTPGQS